MLRWAVNGKEHDGNPANYKLFDGDVIKVGPLTVTAYLAPGHSPSPTSWLALPGWYAAS